MCTRGGQETPAPLWWGEHAGLDTASHGAALVRGSNEASLEPEKYRSSTGLRDEIGQRLTGRETDSA